MGVITVTPISHAPARYTGKIPVVSLPTPAQQSSGGTYWTGQSAPTTKVFPLPTGSVNVRKVGIAIKADEQYSGSILNTAFKSLTTVYSQVNYANYRLKLGNYTLSNAINLSSDGRTLKVATGILKNENPTDFWNTSNYYISGSNNSYDLANTETPTTKPTDWFFGWVKFNYLSVDYLGFMVTPVDRNTLLTVTSYRYGVAYAIEDLEKIGHLEGIEFDDEYGELSTEGGYNGGTGSFDDSSDIIGIPNKPQLSVSSMGFVNVYKPTQGSLRGMVDELFPTIDIPDLPSGDLLSDVVNGINNMTEMLANGIIQFTNKNLLDYVLDCHIIPVSPLSTGGERIRVGYKSLSISAPKVSDDYVDFNCGTLNIKEYYNNYLDYIDSCRIRLYLPFVGFVPLLPEYVLNGSISVHYRFNILDGSFCAWIVSTSSKSKLTDSVIGSFSGNCCVHVPISATNYANILSGLVGGVSNAINSISTPSTPTQSTNNEETTEDGVTIGGGAVSGIMSVMSAKPNVQLSNGYNATSSYSGIRYPYLIIERPVASFSKNYPHDKGLPLNVTKKLSDIHGKTVITNLHTDNLTCSLEEKSRIKSAFARGVVL